MQDSSRLSLYHRPPPAAQPSEAESKAPHRTACRTNGSATSRPTRRRRKTPPTPGSSLSSSSALSARLPVRTQQIFVLNRHRRAHPCRGRRSRLDFGKLGAETSGDGADPAHYAAAQIALDQPVFTGFGLAGCLPRGRRPRHCFMDDGVNEDRSSNVDRRAAEWVARLDGRPLDDTERARRSGAGWRRIPTIGLRSMRRTARGAVSICCGAIPARCAPCYAPPPARRPSAAPGIAGIVSILVLGLLGLRYQIGDPWIAPCRRLAHRARPDAAGNARGRHLL